MLANDLGWLDAVALRDLVADGDLHGGRARGERDRPHRRRQPDAERRCGAAARHRAGNRRRSGAAARAVRRRVRFSSRTSAPAWPAYRCTWATGCCDRWIGAHPPTPSWAPRFRAAGVVTIGKTALPEFGCQPTTQSITFGACLNPWDTTRSTAGSSGGAAAAVAAGLVPVAHASDIGGSIRLPAAWCGVVGLKPSRGRTSSLPITDPNLVEHVITRSVRDTAAFLDAIGGADPTDIYRLPPPDAPYATTMSKAPDGLRIGYVESVESIGVTVGR